MKNPLMFDKVISARILLVTLRSTTMKKKKNSWYTLSNLGGRESSVDLSHVVTEAHDTLKGKFGIFSAYVKCYRSSCYFNSHTWKASKFTSTLLWGEQPESLLLCICFKITETVCRAGPRGSSS